MAACADIETGVTKGAALRLRIPIFLFLLALVWTPVAAAAKARSDLADLPRRRRRLRPPLRLSRARLLSQRIPILLLTA